MRSSQRIGIIAMALLVLAGVLSPLISHANAVNLTVALETVPAATTGISRFDGEFAMHTYSAYTEYIRANRNITNNTHEFTITASNLSEMAPSSYVEYDFMGFAGPVLITGEDGTNTWEFYVHENGLYMLEFEFFPLPGRGNNIEKSLYINGVQPFRELAGISFQRRWQSAGPILQDRMGNDIQPGLIEVPGWYTQGVKDFRGYYTDPFRIYLEAGLNTLSLVSVRDSMAISQIRFFYQEPAISYAEYLAAHSGVAASSDVLLMLQAQYADMTSASTLVPATDRSSAATVPSSPSTHRLNSINGNNWRFPRQWLSWDIYVEEAGLYQISMRWKQDEISGFSSARKILINGELPFAEAAEIIFPFTTRWQLTTVSDDNGVPFLFYLNQGHNTIQIEATTGQMAHIVARVDESLVVLNSIYRQIVQITGVIPDPGRDFNLERYIPDALEELANQGLMLEQILEDLNAHGGGGGQSSASIQRLIVQIDQMTRRPDRLHRRVTDFQSDLSGLADWLVWALVQPLTLDYVVVSSPDAELPRANSRFFASLWFHFRMFLASFRDGNTYLGDETGTETITVWIGGGTLGGRDQAQVLRRLIDNHFTPQYGINVNLQLVQMGSLLPATFAGQNPEVALQLGTAEIINYGLRGALLDLTQFDDFDDIADRFTPQTWIPYVFADSVYGVPETMNFPMLYYRRDVLAELGFEIDGNITWDDILWLLPDVLKNNMSMWIPPDVNSYFMFLRQFGGDFYHQNSILTSLDTSEAFRAFRFFTNFYALHDLPVHADFLSRFRTGETPIGIADYTLANTLSIVAPEIRGLWGFMPVPGVLTEDGTINNTGYMFTAGCVIMEQSENHNAAWEFVKWWTSAQTQSMFGREIEAVMGTAGRYTTANLDALATLPWSATELDRIMEQLLVSYPRREMPGGYYTDRLINFAILNVIISEYNPRETLSEFAKRIDVEILTKAEELGIDVNTVFRDVR